MAQLVRTTREQQRLTQTDLAREAGISQPMLALLESGKRRINDAMVQKLWAALWRIDQERKNVPPAIELLIRLDGDLP